MVKREQMKPNNNLTVGCLLLSQAREEEDAWYRQAGRQGALMCSRPVCVLVSDLIDGLIKTDVIDGHERLNV